MPKMRSRYSVEGTGLAVLKWDVVEWPGSGTVEVVGRFREEAHAFALLRILRRREKGPASPGARRPYMVRDLASCGMEGRFDVYGPGFPNGTKWTTKRGFAADLAEAMGVAYAEGYAAGRR